MSRRCAGSPRRRSDHTSRRLTSTAAGASPRWPAGRSAPRAEDPPPPPPAAPPPTLLQRDTRAVWVALDRARPADLQLLTDVFHFHPLAVEDAQKTGQRPQIEAYG